MKSNLDKIQNKSLEAAIKKAEREKGEASRLKVYLELKRSRLILAIHTDMGVGVRAAQQGDSFQVLQVQGQDGKKRWAAFTNKENFQAYRCSGFLEVDVEKLLRFAAKQGAYGIILNPGGPVKWAVDSAEFEAVLATH